MFIAPETDEIVKPAWQPPESDEIVRGDIKLDTPDRLQRALKEQGVTQQPPLPYLANTSEGLAEIVNDPSQIPAALMGLASIPGQVAYQAAADVVSQVARRMPTLGQVVNEETGAVTQYDAGNHAAYGGNILYGDRKPWEAAPVDVFLADVAETNPAWATAGRVAESLAAMAPLAAVGMLPATAQKLLAAGFTADMIAHAPGQFQAYGEEINKPYAEQNADTLARLRSDIIQTFAFAPLAGAHAVKGVPAEIGYALDLARGMTPDAPRARPDIRTSGRGASLPAEEGAAVPAWEAGDMIVRSAEPSAPRPSPLAPPKELPPPPETTPAPSQAAPPRAAEPIQAASAPGAGVKTSQPAKALPELGVRSEPTVENSVARLVTALAKVKIPETLIQSEVDAILSLSKRSVERKLIEDYLRRTAAARATPGLNSVNGIANFLTNKQAERALAASRKIEADVENQMETAARSAGVRLKRHSGGSWYFSDSNGEVLRISDHPSGEWHAGGTFLPIDRAQIVGVKPVWELATRWIEKKGNAAPVAQSGVEAREPSKALPIDGRSQGETTIPPVPVKPAETPAAAVAKVQEHVAEVKAGKPVQMDGRGGRAAGGMRPAKEIKTELVQRLEAAIAAAPFETVTLAQEKLGRAGKAPQKITIEIPGDGTFTVWNAKEALREVLAKAKRLDTTSGKSPAKLPTNRKLDVVEEARRVYGDDRTAIARLRQQAENFPDLAPETKADLLDAATTLEAGLPENVAARRLEQWRGDLANATERLNKATEQFEARKAEAKALRQQRDERLAAKKPISAISARLAAADRAADRVRIDVNQSKQSVEAAQTRIAAEEQAIAKLKSSNPSSGRVGSPPALGGGNLGNTPPPRGPVVADDPRHSVFDAMPMEMPEAVQMVKQLTGVFPEIRENLGDAAGVFTFTQGPAGKGKVSLLAKIFDLLDANDKARIKQEAINYAEAANPGATPAQKSRLANERYQFLLREAYDKAKLENPKQAMKTMWHEIGHVVDWLPDRIIRGRGNLFARLASLKGYFKHVLPLDPKRVGPFQEKPTPGELTKLRKEAYDAAQAEIGPMREIVEKILVEEPIYREAGITAKMVTDLMGLDARETMPELYRWFAEQSGKVKAEIVRAAMKGMVDERLKNVAGAGREQIGTRKIEREVRRREGRPPTPQEVEAKFKKLFRAELERRNIAELATVKRELEGLIAWWRGTERMPDYFKTSWEMYADAFSVFANNPAALESRAPTYAKLIWNYLDRKPEVKALYDQIQGDIKNGAVMPKRIQTLHEMWGRADAQSLDLAKSAGKLTGKDVLDNVQYHVDRRFGPIYRAAQGTRFQGRIADAVGNFLYRMSEHERYLASLNEQVGKLLVKHNLDWTNDLGEYLFHRRIVHERFNLANPLGWTSKNSIERLAELRTTLGPERWAALEEAGKRYRAEYERFVVAELESAKMFNPELQAAIAERAHYATFAALKGMPDEGIAKILETRFGTSVTPHIYSQIGNLGEIKNPATATVLKGLSLISSAYRNTMKKEVVRMLGELHPEDIMPAKTRWSGKGIEPIIVDNNPAVGTVVYLDQGKVRAFYVRRVVADAVNSATGGDNLAYSLLLNATGWQKGLFTQLNYGFWPFNFVKDTLGWWFQMPGITAPYYWAKNLPKAIMAARQSVTHSKPNPWADAALRRKMLISKGDPRGVWAAAENEFEVKLASFGMDPAQWKGQGDAVHRLVKAWDYYKNLGQTFERVNKINGMLYLDEKFASMPEWKKREIVRERGGSPNFLERGAANPMIDLVALFYNPWKESLRSVTKAARENPWSFATKATTAVLMPTILQAAAVNGWLGPDRKEQYDSIPDFDLTNYLVVPLGWVDRDARKVMYLRLPLWEPARVAHGLLFQSLTPRGKGLGAHAGGQLPGLNPMWKIGLAWASYLQGNNPVDTTRGVAVMPDKVFAAGGPATLAEMAKYTWNEMGGSVVYRFKNLNLESAPESEGEKFLAMPGVNNALGRWLKVSDRGLADQQRSLAGQTEQARAEVQLGVDEILRRLTGEGAWDNLLQSLKTGDQAAMQRAMQAAQLTDAEKMLMRDPYALQYFTRKFPELVLSKASPDARMWFNAQSNEERAKLLQKGLIQPKPIR